MTAFSASRSPGYGRSVPEAVDHGSSGAPVFDANGKVVGMHHAGFGPFGEGIYKGYAVRMAFIAEDLAKKGLRIAPAP